MEELLKRKVKIKCVCRITPSTMNNVWKLETLLKKYTQLEIRHRAQPVRGFIVDDMFVSLKTEQQLKEYKPQELEQNLTIIYNIYETEWVSWIQKVFWNLYRSSSEVKGRMKEFVKL